MVQLSNTYQLSDEVIMSQLHRILDSSVFKQAERQHRFLEFIISQTLAGKADKLNGFVIGLEVFDRDDSFDPAIDSIVRVEAARLRSKLQEYYLSEGRHDPVTVEMPKGKYVPVFKPGPYANANINSKPDILNSLFPVRPSNSIAVLPLLNLSGDPGQEYFSDSITDAIINTLAHNRILKVISMTSVMTYKGINKNIRNIADELHVTYVLEGSILKEKNLIRLSIQLIDCMSDHHIWAESYERELTGIISLQRELATTISHSLLAEINAQVSHIRTVNSDSHDAVSKVNYYNN